ncbi:hypothetical protein V461_06320 [Pantoea ananatis BRT98]|nr:hypothetical protein V461_06320 [Pantoea ananatis BRT98]
MAEGWRNPFYCISRLSQIFMARRKDDAPAKIDFF